MPAMVQFTQGDASIAFGFQATAILFFGAAQTAAGNTENAAGIIGAMDAVGTHAVAAMMHDDGTNNVGNGYYNGVVAVIDGVSGTSGPAADGVLALATAVHTATGVNLTWSTNDAVARRYVALAFDSTEITSSLLFDYQYPTSPAWRTRGIYWPHTPDGVLHFGTFTSTIKGDAWSGTTVSYMKFGAVDENLDQFITLSQIRGANAARYQQSGQMAAGASTSGVLTTNGAVTDLREHAGISWHFDVAGGSNQWLSGYLMLKCASGYDLRVGSFTGETGTAPKTQDVAVPGTPIAVMIASVDAGTFTLNTPTYTSSALQFGAAIEGLTQYGFWKGKVDTGDVSDTYYATDRVIHSATPGTPTLNSRAAVSGLSLDKFTLNWDTLDATARQYFYVALCERTDVDAGYGLVRIVVPNTTDPRSIYQAVSGATPAIGDEFQWDDASGHNIDQFGVITGPIGTFQAKYREKGGTWTSAATITLGAPVAGAVSGRLSMSALRRRRRT